MRIVKMSELLLSPHSVYFSQKPQFIIILEDYKVIEVFILRKIC